MCNSKNSRQQEGRGLLSQFRTPTKKQNSFEQNTIIRQNFLLKIFFAHIHIFFYQMIAPYD